MGVFPLGQPAGMELSELVWYAGRLLTCDDHTGVVYEVRGGAVVPAYILADGDGHQAHTFKCEWAGAPHAASRPAPRLLAKEPCRGGAHLRLAHTLNMPAQRCGTACCTWAGWGARGPTRPGAR